MLSTRNLEVREVPEAWIFEHFAGLSTDLNRSEVKMHSLFNPRDRTPSMYIFWSARLGKYWFHDFSTGKTGDACKLVQELYQCNYAQACQRIVKEYMSALPREPLPSGVTTTAKFQVAQYQTREWNTDDAAYWTAYHIDSHLLDHFGVRPLEWYSMENGAGEQFTSKGGYIYGYFAGANELYKIYQPKRQRGKFIKHGNYLQGMSQLEGRKCLLIVSSLKDGMSLKSLRLDVDFVAPDSENSILNPDVINELRTRYQDRIIVALDHDEAGMRAMKEYRKRFNIPPLLLNLAKDLSDSVKQYGALFVRDRLVPLIDEKLNNPNH